MSVKGEIRRFLAENEKPLLHQLSPYTIAALQSGTINTSYVMPKNDHDLIMVTWRNERGLAPVVFRSPVEKWLAWRVTREARLYGMPVPPAPAPTGEAPETVQEVAE